MRVKKNRIKNKEQRQNRNKIIFYSLFFIFYSLYTSAQCAMCRASLESSGETKQAEAVNDGIVFLMIIPYILVAIIGFGIYRMYYRKK